MQLLYPALSWNIGKGAKVGKYNGLKLLLDAETFDYWYQVGAYIFVLRALYNKTQTQTSTGKLNQEYGSKF